MATVEDSLASYAFYAAIQTYVCMCLYIYIYIYIYIDVYTHMLVEARTFNCVI